MKTGAIIGITAGFVVLLGGYLFLTKKPKITISNLDKKTKTATVKIGSKTVDYKHDKISAMQVPKVGIMYDAEIKPNDRDANNADIQIKKGGKIKATQSIVFVSNEPH